MSKKKSAEVFRDTQRMAQKALTALLDEKPNRAVFALLLAGAWTANALGWERSHVMRIVGHLYDASKSTQKRQNETDPSIN